MSFLIEICNFFAVSEPHVQALAPLVAAGIAALGSLASGLFGSAAAAKQAKQQRAAEMENQAFETQKEGVKQLGKGQQDAFEQLMGGYRSALL